jgi:hypothetical protein
MRVVAALALMACHAASAADTSSRAADVFRDAAREQIRVGARQPLTNQGELGSIESARLSPDGRWTAVLDAVTPNIKIADSTGRVSKVISLAGDTARDYLPPVIAMADDRLLLAWPDSTSALVIGLRSGTRESIDGVSFVPLAATALTNETWLVYGPSRPIAGVIPTWIHCYTRAADGRGRWSHGLRDSVRVSPESLVAPVITIVNGEAVVEHRGRRALLVGARCTQGVGDSLTVRVVASERPSAEQTHDPEFTDVDPRGPGIALASPGDGGAALIGSQRDARKLFGLIHSRGRTVVRRLRVSGDVVRAETIYEILDSRDGVGTLFLSSTQVPRAFLLAPSVLRSVIGPAR